MKLFWRSSTRILRRSLIDNLLPVATRSGLAFALIIILKLNFRNLISWFHMEFHIKLNNFPLFLAFFRFSRSGSASPRPTDTKKDAYIKVEQRRKPKKYFWNVRPSKYLLNDENKISSDDVREEEEVESNSGQPKRDSGWNVCLLRLQQTSPPTKPSNSVNTNKAHPKHPHFLLPTKEPLHVRTGRPKVVLLHRPEIC